MTDYTTLAASARTLAGQTGWQAIADYADGLEELVKERDRLREAGAKVIEGFDRRFFVRNIDLDKDTGWAMLFGPYLAALAALAKS